MRCSRSLGLRQNPLHVIHDAPHAFPCDDPATIEAAQLYEKVASAERVAQGEGMGMPKVVVADALAECKGGMI